jgi:hypothetical protein
MNVGWFIHSQLNFIVGLDAVLRVDYRALQA